ncbi:UAP56-interacting factor-like isoform X2 [Anolis sagrei]|uniref:UAP56-interacting factor-like isoform X2 n=1 Tax=Anolis sagrei TaxID=38937 RepID=UPI00352121E6
MDPPKEPQPNPEPTGSGSGSTAGGEIIDLSLDDIIKRNKKGQAKPKGNRWRQPLKNRNPPYSNGRPGFRRWVPGNLQGPNRFRGGFRKQQFYRKPAWKGVTNGTSPLNRTLSAQQGKQDEASMTTDGVNNGVTAVGPQRPPPIRAQRFQNARALPFHQSNRPFWKNPGPPFFRRQPRFKFGQRQMQPKAEGKPPRIRRWQTRANSGAVLTVSVSNPQASQANAPGGKRPFRRERGTAAKVALHQPKGVPLRFNFRAMANQTSLMLNERFSGLRGKRRFPATRSTSRMVTLP